MKSKTRKMKNLLLLVFTGLTTFCIGQTNNANHYPKEAQRINKVAAGIDNEKLTTKTYFYIDDYEDKWVLYVSRGSEGNIKTVEFSIYSDQFHNNIYYLDQDQVCLIMAVEDRQDRWVNQQQNNYYLQNGDPFYQAFRHKYKTDFITDTGSVFTEFTEEQAIPLYTNSKHFEDLISRSKISE